MPLNQGLTQAEVAERVNRLVCPMCVRPLRVLVRREWASCGCCGVDYSKALDDRGAEWVVSRYLPDGHPDCAHYRLSRPRREPEPYRGL